MKRLIIFCRILLVLCGSKAATGQVHPPQPISVFVNPAQGMNFGAFFQGITGGTVILYPNGSRSVTGDIIQAGLGFSFSPAIFEIEALPGTIIHVLNGPDIQLTGTNGGSLTLHLGTSDPSTPFITTAIPPSRTLVRIGGTLTVSSPIANPSGSYSGMFQVTFIQE